MKQSLKIAFIGFCMGTVDVVPGVSGGTIALLFGVYQRLVTAIRNTLSVHTVRFIAKGKWQALWSHIDGTFITSIAAGIGVGILSIAHVIEYFLRVHPPQTWGFFFGMVILSTLLVGHRVQQWTRGRIGLLVLAAIAAWFFVQITAVSTPSTWWFLLLCGMVASMAMILPGVSGSFLLLVLGQYEIILAAIKSLNIFVLLPVAIGAVIGLGLFSYLLKHLLTHYHDRMLAILTGLMLGSTWRLWPWKVNPTDMNSANIGFDFSSNSLVLVSLIAAGMIVTWLLHFISIKNN